MVSQVIFKCFLLLVLSSAVYAIPPTYTSTGSCSVSGCSLNCGNVNYDLSTIADGSSSGTGTETVYPAFK